MDWTENAWQDRHGENKNSCKGPFEVEDFGVRSFWIQIDNPNDQLFEPEKVPDSTYSNNVFTKLLHTDYFNTLTEGKHCFVNSSSSVNWRVKACCTLDGKNCGPYVNWHFTTSPAPELIGITDKNHSEPIVDPDWNGTDQSTGIDFCSAVLHWCAAEVAPEKRPYNQGQQFCLSYQVANHSDENQVTNRANSYIPEKFTKYADWLLLNDQIYGPRETCHYLEKRDDGACVPEVVNPTTTKTQEPRLYFLII